MILSVALREPEASTLPPTDSRLRGDRRSLEFDDLTTAGKEKHRLEEEQRAKRKLRESKGETYVPKYFTSTNDATWGHRWVYIGNYWEEREKRIQEYNTKKEEQQKSAQEQQKVAEQQPPSSQKDGEGEAHQ